MLVCGSDLITAAEILQLPRGDNERGVWTLLTQEMTQYFSRTYLMNFNNRIVAVGESLITLVAMNLKHLSNLYCLLLRLRWAVR